MDVHIRDLRYFVEVADTLHFTRAAESLSISQPTLSKQLRVLEAQLGTALFDRDHRSVRLTAAGEALLPHARAVIAGWEAAAAAVASAQATLIVGMSTAPSRGLWPAVRREINRTAPGLQLVLRQVAWSDATGGLADRSSDAALVWLPLPDAQRFDWLVVAEEPRMVALPAGHRLAAQGVVDFAELLDEPFLALPPSRGPPRALWRAGGPPRGRGPDGAAPLLSEPFPGWPRSCGRVGDFGLGVVHRGGRAPYVAAEIHSAEETAEAVAAGLGVALVATGNAVLLARPDIAVVPVAGVGPATLALAWRRSDDRTTVGALREAVRSAH